jgi:hypothetical protein
MLQHDDPKLLEEIYQLKKGSPKAGEPTLYLSLARYENNPFLLYSCLHYARQQGLAVHFSADKPVDHRRNKT